MDRHLRTPYTYQYNLSIQHELIKDLVVEAAYVGSSSHKLTSLVDANSFVLKNPNIVRLFNTQPGVANDSFSFLDEFRNVVNVSYNSLQLSLLKRVSHNRFFGTSYFTLAYTYGHSIDNASGFRERNSIVPFYNPKQFRASSDFDIRHRITFSGGWDLPFDQAWSSGPKRVIKGWSVYPIVTYRTGFPLDVFAGGDFFDDQDTPGPSGAGDAGQVRANLVGNSVVIFEPKTPQTFNNRTGNFYFNPANFSVTGLDSDGTAAVLNPSLSTYGSLPRNFFRAPRRVNFDFAIAKLTPLIAERLNMEFRAEFFNILNHAEFGSPNTIRTSSQFGQISTTADPRIIQFAIRFTF